MQELVNPSQALLPKPKTQQFGTAPNTESEGQGALGLEAGGEVDSASYLTTQNAEFEGELDPGYKAGLRVVRRRRVQKKQSKSSSRGSRNSGGRRGDPDDDEGEYRDADSDSEEEDEDEDTPSMRKERIVRRVFTWTTVSGVFVLGILALASASYGIANGKENPDQANPEGLYIFTIVIAIIAILAVIGFVILKFRKRKRRGKRYRGG